MKNYEVFDMDKRAIDGWMIWIQSVKEHIESVELDKKDGKNIAMFTLKKSFPTLGKFVKNLSASHNNDLKKPCTNCEGRGWMKSFNEDVKTECLVCKGQGFIKS